MVGNDGQRGVGRLRAAVLLGAMSVLVPIAPAVAQEQGGQESATARQFLTITSAEALLRCAAGSYYYPIRKLQAGDVVVGLGTENEWIRIEYPDSTPVFVGADVATRQGETVRLTEASRLKAANLNYGLRGSWKAVYEEPLKAGTTMHLLEVAKADDGADAAYLVEAPAGATGYVHESSVREATPEEAARFKAAKLPATKKGDEAEPTGTATPPSVSPSDSDVDALPPGAQLEEELVPEGPGATQPASEPVVEAPVEAPTTPDDAVSIDQSDRTPEWGPNESPAEASSPDDPATARPVASPAALDEAFRTVYSQSVFEAEYDELIAEFRRAVESVDTSTPEGRTLKRRLEARIDLLELKRDVQYEQRSLAEATKKIDDKAAKLAEQLSALERTQSYTIVGRLVPSTVYDGVRLPLMYRIQSVGQAVPRTLGYVRPGTGLNVDAKLGEVVGVVGHAALDKSLKLRVVQPERVDVLAPAPEVTVSVPDDGG